MNDEILSGEKFDFNNFYTLFLPPSDSLQSSDSLQYQVDIRKIEEIGPAWTEFTLKYPELFRQAQILSESYWTFRNGWHKEVRALIKEKNYAKAEALTDQNEPETERLKKEMDIVLKKAFDILVSMGVSPDLLIR